jgi:glutamine synthetase
MTARKEILLNLSKRVTQPKNWISRPALEQFGENVFSERVQKERLSTDVFKSLQRIILEGEELTPKVANAVAQAMKEWALEKGATHFCHWFQPMTDLTAEKHDNFFIPSEKGGAVAEFSGKELIRGESDASSFPSGGLRTTFEARGYTAWDPSSPAFIFQSMSGCFLIIPTLFLSWTGEALDEKTPLLRSGDILCKHALRILRLFGDQKTKKVYTTVGTEQEFFLIDAHFFNLRPDLINCGRTLFGAKPPRGQELEDQYFATIPERILGVMYEVEYELMRIGVPVKTRHNEVAPSQYEFALLYEHCTKAVDHHMLLMEVLKRVADRHGMNCLLHEKPFAGINGSGKHSNWSLAKDDGTNLLEPGDTPQENAQFLLFCSAVIRGIYKYSALLRLSVASASNDHRLGKHEAPPAIMSVFLGEQLSDIFKVLKDGSERPTKNGNLIEIGISFLPKISRQLSDRNRTSPFAFTGNKFEFRAVGSSQNIAKSMSMLNTIVADSLDYFATILEEGLKEGKEPNLAVKELLIKNIRECHPILYEGDNYSEQWLHEAQMRGLPNVTNTVDAALLYTSQEAIALFTKCKVFSRRELESRQEATLVKYVRKIRIEAMTAINIAQTIIFPAALKFLKEIGEALPFLHNGESEIIKSLTVNISALRKAIKGLEESMKKHLSDQILDQAIFMRDKILIQLAELRRIADTLETIIDDEIWPLPKYQEMLFIR